MNIVLFALMALTKTKKNVFLELVYIIYLRNISRCVAARMTFP